MKKAFLLATILFISVISTACINNFAVQELNNKAQDFMEKGDYASAIERLKSSVDLDGSIFETQYNLAVAYTKAEDYANAIKTYNDAIKLNPDFPDSYYSLAVCEENLAKDIKNEWIATLNIYYNNGTNKKVIEKSSGTFEIINNELIYYRTKTMQRESNIEIPNVSAFVIKNQRLILKENYLKNYEKSITLK